MGDVRGDVVALGFIQTTIMEWGNQRRCKTPAPPCGCTAGNSPDASSLSAIARSSIGRSTIYTREFPYIWDEIQVPITYQADRARAEAILLESATRHALNREEIGDKAVRHLREKYQVEPIDLDPSVYYRLTDNWLELTLRFIAPDHGVRRIKNKMSREIIASARGRE